MKAFSGLFAKIDSTTSTNEKIDALATYLVKAGERDAAWCVALLAGKRPKRTVRSGELRDWCAQVTGIPVWLLEESYHVVGDLAETIALLLPGNGDDNDAYSLDEVMNRLMQLGDKAEDERAAYIMHMWRSLPQEQLFIFNKLITGGFRMGVSARIIIKALSVAYNIDSNIIAHKLSGNWHPAHTTLNDLLHTDSADISRPYPFFLAYALDKEPSELGDISNWMIERKLDGIRGQVIVRNNELFVWSRGEDLLTNKFIEFHPLVSLLPGGTVLDGEIIPYKGGSYLPFHVMQTRIGRKNVTKKTLAEAPLVMVCYDLLEQNGEDIRHLPLSERRQRLEQVVQDAQATLPDVPLILSPLLQPANWQQAEQERMNAREHISEGLMLKHKDSTYQVGRRRGDWWKWKIDPLTADAVLIYAQRGHGRRADLYTDFTFAVWDGDTLVPFAKAYSGLTDKELVELDRWIKKNTKENFGPVRSVTPYHVFELGFEGINPSSRHKSGVAVRFPRILRWRKDKTAREANTKEDLLALINAQG